jgi:chloramphenicol 3-O-phosphotransferase
MKIKKCNRYHAIQRQDIIFKSKVSEDQKQEAVKSINTISAFFKNDKEYITYRELLDRKTRRKILEHINQYARKGKNVILDTWLLNEDDFSQIRARFTLFKGIAYAPLRVLLERIIKRNKTAQETGNLISKRFIRQPLSSFRQLYNFSTQDERQQPTSGIILDTLDKNEFIECIEFARSQLTLHREITSQELDAYKQRMLALFNGPELLITADPSYDFVVHTATNTPEFYAKLIRKKVKSFNKE